MDQKLLLIGSKPHSFNIDKCIDSFTHNVRFNINTPGNNNGTLYDMHILNCHVSLNIKREKSRFINRYSPTCKREQLDVFYENHKRFKPYPFTRNQDMKIFNALLAKHNINIKLTKQTRLGFVPILHSLSGKEKRSIYLFGYSLPGNNEISLYSKLKTHNDSHNIEKEQKIIVELHKCKLLDASLCCIVDKIGNTVYMKRDIIEPTHDVIKMLSKFYNVAIVDSEMPPQISSKVTSEVKSVDKAEVKPAQ